MHQRTHAPTLAQTRAALTLLLYPDLDLLVGLPALALYDWLSFGFPIRHVLVAPLAIELG